MLSTPCFLCEASFVTLGTRQPGWHWDQSSSQDSMSQSEMLEAALANIQNGRLVNGSSFKLQRFGYRYQDRQQASYRPASGPLLEMLRC